MIIIGPAQNAGVTLGVLEIGNFSATPPAPINLMAATVDPRITYSGPAHAYRAQAGGLAQSSANQWPLEYAGGVAVGRHMPEKATTNIIRDNRFVNVGSGLEWSSTGGGVREPAPTGAIDGGQGYRVTSTYSKPAIYDGSSFIVPDSTSWTSISLGAVWAHRHVTGIFAAAASAARFYPARQDASNYVYATDAAPAGSVTLSVIRRDNGDATDTICLPQAEAGSVVTSPVLTGTTRAPSSVTVAKDGSAVGITLFYNDGTSAMIDFNGTSSIVLPVSLDDWAARYLQTIAYRI